MSHSSSSWKIVFQKRHKHRQLNYTHKKSSEQKSEWIATNEFSHDFHSVCSNSRRLLLFWLLSFFRSTAVRFTVGILFLFCCFNFISFTIPLGWHSVILNENNESLHFQQMNMEMCSMWTGREWQWRLANVKWGNQKNWPGKKSPRKHWNAVEYLCGSRKWRAPKK